MNVDMGTIPGACGVGYINHFGLGRESVTHLPDIDGCGWITAGFVNTKPCRDVYAEMKKNYKIVYQSPVRRNENSDNMFFFVVYDRRGKPNDQTKT